jgi:5-methyltetrahydropteroyltriglutamate--homocysteine methyltransferase
MKRSVERILTTHVGSLPRPLDLVDMVVKEMRGEDVDSKTLEPRVRAAVKELVERQTDIGIDIVSDGEASKSGFSNYIINRYTGFGGDAVSAVPSDLAEFPDVRKRIVTPTDPRSRLLLQCVGPIKLRSSDALERDIDNLSAALNGRDKEDAFIAAVTPGQITFNFPNEYYPSHEAYLQATAEAMRTEYEAIVNAGFTLQLDAPDMALSAHLRWGEQRDWPDFQTHLRMSIDAVNTAVANIPADKMRLHICWGNYVGPHHHDIPLRDILQQVLKAKPAGLSIEAANPRHEHEWEVFQDIKLPPGKFLIPGVIDTKTHHIEHPRLIAQRLARFAAVVGRENIIAGTDCGFSTFAGLSLIDPGVVWAKLASLVEGARLATNELW